MVRLPTFYSLTQSSISKVKVLCSSRSRVIPYNGHLSGIRLRLSKTTHNKFLVVLKGGEMFLYTDKMSTIIIGLVHVYLQGL